MYYKLVTNAPCTSKNVISSIPQACISYIYFGVVSITSHRTADPGHYYYLRNGQSPDKDDFPSE